MVIARLLFLVLGLASIVCFGLYAATGQPKHLRHGLRIAKSTVGAALLFFVVLAVERLWSPF